MTDHNSTITKPIEAANYAAIAAAVIAAVGGYKLFEPKLERMRAIRNEMGRLTWGMRLFYQWPQYFLILATGMIAVDLSAAFFDVLHPGVLTNLGPPGWLDAILAPETTIWVIFAVPLVGLVIYWNGLPRLLLWLAWLLSALPIPGLRNKFGQSGGESLGWHQTNAVMEGPDKGQPLMIDDQGVERVAWTVLSRLSKNADAGDFAAEPADLSDEEKANILLFGCIMEAIHYGQGWPSPKWGDFYGALADIQRTTQMFDPQKLLSYANGQAFFEDFRDKLEGALKTRQQPSPPDRSLAAAGDISRAWELLKKRAQCDLLKLAPSWSKYFGGQQAWLDHRLRSFPQLASVGMRPQLIKLLIRWKTLGPSPGVFAQPFSKGQAWLLFQEGALRALPETKEVTFNGKSQVPIARLAALRVIRRVAEIIQEEVASEAKSVAIALGPDNWARLERSDFTLWSWAREAATQARGQTWDKTKWRWKLDGERVQRTN